jgi:hypothetical protein
MHWSRQSGTNPRGELCKMMHGFFFDFSFLASPLRLSASERLMESLIRTDLLYDVWWLNVREYRGIVYRKLVELSTSSS